MIVEQQAIPEVFVARNNDPWLIAVVYPVVQDSTLNVVSMNPRTSFRRLLSQLVVAWILQVLDQLPAPFIVLVCSLDVILDTRDFPDYNTVDSLVVSWPASALGT